MKKLFLLSSCVVFGLFGLSNSAHAQTLTSVNWTFTPANVSAVVGQPFSVVFRVTSTSGQPVDGFVSIDKIVNTSDQTVTNPVQTQVPITATGNGTNAIVYALSPAGTYTVDMCFQQTTSSGCLVTPSAFRVTITNPAGPAPTPQTQTTPTSAGSDAATTTSGVVSIPNPIRCNTAQCLITQVIRYVFGIIAVLATFMFIWGGVLMLTSAGNAQRVKQAKDTLTYAAIGIVVILLSWSAIQFVINGIK